MTQTNSAEPVYCLDRIKTVKTKAEKSSLLGAWHNYCSILDKWVDGLRPTPSVTLKEAYKNPSALKQDAYDDCLAITKAYSGFFGTIIYAGCQTFSFGFQTYDARNDDLYFVYITKYSMKKMLVRRNGEYVVPRIF